MAPVAVPVEPVAAAPLKAAAAQPTPAPSAPLLAYAHFDNTPAVGTEFPASTHTGAPVLSIRDILADDAKVAALATLIAERGVVFFRNAIITPEEQTRLIDALGVAGIRPPNAGLHIHPCTLESGRDGDHISRVSNQFVYNEKLKTSLNSSLLTREAGKERWHTDVSFEPVPASYACLQIRDLPPTGGDTLWASAYEAYDRLSPPVQALLEGLTAIHEGTLFLDVNKENGGQTTFRTNRGHPLNSNQDLRASHPVIRTHPVTGWKGLFVNKMFTRRINEVTKEESDVLLAFLFEHIHGNHDLQVRFRWEENSLAIWDNRSTLHAATLDVDGATNREGTRAVSVGDVPVFDPASKSRREALGLL
ncbi:Putative alpha-ketoglutarate-dependent sulfonate dioxygenase [Vanrija pseudolonga]|uniref:Alpha-ketoglutarate-dependent sulfonate dioxygenase n=1 Tax=Vanrija pseudolonga TaxID=143232 RepID=A0AAF0YEI5_9TREE|nr:Putative alpha-ketoglutarate-dependent sulfonate dioxygenase [Vanrija pseudolonga]